MKIIQFDGKNIAGVHVLTTVTDGNHVPYAVKKLITLFDVDLQPITITEWEYENKIVGTGIRKYSGTVERGGGKHSFYGVDINDAKQYLAEEMGKSVQLATA